MNGAADTLKKYINIVYFNDMPLTEKDLHVSRKVSIFEGCTARSIVTICSGPFLAGLAGFLGANDQENGIIGAIPTLAGIIMVLSPMIFEKLRRRKFLITYAAFFSRILLSMMFLIPFIIRDSALSRKILIGMFLAASLSVSFITPAALNWQISLADERIRGSYFGKRESVVLGFVAITALAMGGVLDFYKKAGSEHTGFMMLFLAAFILTIANFILTSLIDEPEVKLENGSLKVKDLFMLPLKCKVFKKVIFLVVLWNAGFQFSAPFTAVYMVSGLKLDYTFITVSVLVMSAASVAGARFLGMLADKKSWISLMGLCVCFQIASQVIWFCINSKTALFLIPAAQILGGIALGGINITLSNLQYLSAPAERKTVYIGFSSAAGGLAGFFSSLLGAALVGHLSSLSVKELGLDINHMQMLFGASGILLSVCLVFIIFLSKKKVVT